MPQDSKSIAGRWNKLTKEQRQKFIDEVERWLLYRDYYAGTWFSSSQKALLQEIYELRKEIEGLNNKKT